MLAAHLILGSDYTIFLPMVATSDCIMQKSFMCLGRETGNTKFEPSQLLFMSLCVIKEDGQKNLSVMASEVMSSNML